MKKKNYSVIGLVQKAIIDSMNFSETEKSQIFVRINPHVNSVEFQAYKGGWHPDTESEIYLRIYTRGILSPTTKECKDILKPLYDFIKNNSKKIVLSCFIFKC